MGPKKNFGDCFPPYIRVWMTAPPLLSQRLDSILSPNMPTSRRTTIKLNESSQCRWYNSKTQELFVWATRWISLDYVLFTNCLPAHTTKESLGYPKHKKNLKIPKLKNKWLKATTSQHNWAPEIPFRVRERSWIPWITLLSTFTERQQPCEVLSRFIALCTLGSFWRIHIWCLSLIS